MKKYLIIFLLFALPGILKAQTDSIPAGLKIGDNLPDITINHIVNYSKTTAHTSDFKGKLLILDFWASWCSPCVSAIPKLNALQKEFDGKIQILSVTYLSEKEVSDFMTKFDPEGKNHLLDVVEDKILHHLFPHQYLPHFVWIDQKGVVKSITGVEEVTADNINQMLNGKTPQMQVKSDKKIPYDRMQPFLMHDNGGDGKNMVYHSVFSKYIEGMPCGAQYFRPDSVKGMKISAWNRGPDLLFKLAYGEGKRTFNRNRMALEVKDTSKITCSKVGNAYLDWLNQGNGYCYELIVPTALAGNAWKYMQEDLDRFFYQYKVTIERRPTKCFALVRTSKNDKIRSHGGNHNVKFDFFGCSLQNAVISEFIGPLDEYYLQNSPVPVIDETGYSENIDLKLNAHIANIKELNRELERYDLKFVEKTVPIDILVFRDRITKPSI